MLILFVRVVIDFCVNYYIIPDIGICQLHLSTGARAREDVTEKNGLFFYCESTARREVHLMVSSLIGWGSTDLYYMDFLQLSGS